MKSIDVPAPIVLVCSLQVEDPSRPAAEYATTHPNDPIRDSLFGNAPDPLRGPPSGQFSLQ